MRFGENVAVTVSEHDRWRRHVEDAAATAILGGLAALPDPSVWTSLLLVTVALGVGLSRAGGRRGAFALLLCVALVVIAAAVGDPNWREASRQLVVAVAVAGVPWLMGSAWRLRTQVRRQAAQHVTESRRQRSLLQEQQRDAERLTFAQTLHDDLGHALSLVALNLGRLELDPGLAPAARESVAIARGQLSQAVGRLGSSVASLRDGSPQGLPPHDDVQELIAQARQAGAEIHLADWPPPERLQGFDETTLVRVLREALTNATKHAPDCPITIQVRVGDDLLRLEVRNSTQGRAKQLAAGHEGGGTGLGDLRRHLEALGGRLEVVVDAERFTVQAEIPQGHSAVEDSIRDGVHADCWTDADEGHEEAVLASARRHGRLILVGAVVLVISGLGVVEVLRVVEARGTVLPAVDFARIEPGDPRGDVDPLLPDHELSPRPVGESGSESDSDCHDYAVTADPLDDASGDVYRICFAGDEVVSARLVTGDER